MGRGVGAGKGRGEGGAFAFDAVASANPLRNARYDSKGLHR